MKQDQHFHYKILLLITLFALLGGGCQMSMEPEGNGFVTFSFIIRIPHYGLQIGGRVLAPGTAVVDLVVSGEELERAESFPVVDIEGERQAVCRLQDLPVGEELAFEVYARDEADEILSFSEFEAVLYPAMAGSPVTIYMLPYHPQSHEISLPINGSAEPGQMVFYDLALNTADYQIDYDNAGEVQVFLYDSTGKRVVCTAEAPGLKLFSISEAGGYFLGVLGSEQPGTKSYTVNVSVYQPGADTPAPTPSATPTPTPTPTSTPTSTPAVNLALGAFVNRSTVEGTFTADLAVDGNDATRWASDNILPAWIYMDLGAVYTIDTVILKWEAAATTFTLAVSDDAAVWTDIHSATSGGNGATDTISGLAYAGRYVRMLADGTMGTHGVSLFEFEVYE